jgi:hypothetical protein
MKVPRVDEFIDDGRGGVAAVSPGGPFGGLSAAEAGRRSAKLTHAKVRAKKEALAALPPEERARARLAEEADDLMKDLLAAARGREPYSTLSPADRFKALTLALAYGIGRPTSTSKAEKAEEPKLPTAEDLF